jgi:hypothetical protein
MTAGLAVAVEAMTLLTWPVWIEEFSMWTDPLGYVAFGGVCSGILLFYLLFFSIQTHQTASDLV